MRVFVFFLFVCLCVLVYVCMCVVLGVCVFGAQIGLIFHVCLCYFSVVCKQNVTLFRWTPHVALAADIRLGRFVAAFPNWSYYTVVVSTDSMREAPASAAAPLFSGLALVLPSSPALAFPPAAFFLAPKLRSSTLTFMVLVCTGAFVVSAGGSSAPAAGADSPPPVVIVSERSLSDLSTLSTSSWVLGLPLRLPKCKKHFPKWPMYQRNH